MIFIPSRGGRSHVPEEWTDLAQIAIGVHTLAAPWSGSTRPDGGQPLTARQHSAGS